MVKWNAYSEASPVCTKLGMSPSIIGNEEQNVLESLSSYVMYDRSSQTKYTNAVRLCKIMIARYLHRKSNS